MSEHAEQQEQCQARGSALIPGDRRGGWCPALPFFSRGDVDGFAGVFSNNLATMLTGAQMLASIMPGEIIYGKIIPAVGVAMAFGSCWYSVMALRLAAKTGRRDVCAIPFGISTPGVFAINSGIILIVYFAEGGTSDAAILAWKVGVMSNLAQGLIALLMVLLGPYISRVVPMVALLGSLASMGLAWLFVNTLQMEALWPMVTFAPFFVIVAALFAGIQLPNLPATIVPVMLAAAIAWLSGKAGWPDVTQAWGEVDWYPAALQLEAFSGIERSMGYLGIAIPVALTVSIGTIQIRQMAANAGDDYDLRWCMLGSALGTIIAALFGSPWGMTVFIGHGAFKDMGAKIGYTLATGVAFVAVCFSGLAAPLLAVFPVQVLNPIILFVGLAVCVEALHVTPERHWPAFLVALVPGLCNWASIVATDLAAAVCSGGFIQDGVIISAKCAVDPHGPEVWRLGHGLKGLRALGEGYVLMSIVWASMLVHIIDRRLIPAACWACAAALMASCGLLHSGTVFKPWDGPAGLGEISHWEFVGGYLLSAGALLALWYVKRPEVHRCTSTMSFTSMDDSPTA